jgi:hypothetical protein
LSEFSSAGFQFPTLVDPSVPKVHFSIKTVSLFGGNGCLGLACHALSYWFEVQTRCSEPRSLPTIGAASRFEPMEPVEVFSEVQDAHGCPGQCLLADDGQDLFRDTSMVFANDWHVQVAVGEREWISVNKYGKKCRRVGVFFQLSC